MAGSIVEAALENSGRFPELAFAKIERTQVVVGGGQAGCELQNGFIASR